MVRKLALAVSLALGTLSVPAHALGLGELSSKSTLNQNFQGDIKLLSVQPDELDGLRVKLADADAFERAGVDRPFYLSLLRFEPVLTSSGKPVIRITSEFPIREPFINFLIEVNWPNGRLLREYTVLLDPPTTTKRRPPSVTPAAKVSKTAPAPAPAKPAAQPAAVAPAPVVMASGSGEGSEYGPVQANDTAWSLAKKLRPRGVSMAQMMMALLNANPDAFVDGNINRLRRGQILRVPALSEIQEMSRQAAREAYRQQQDEWLARRAEKLQSAAEVETAGEAVAGQGSGATSEAPDQLRIATARPEGQGEAGAGDDDALSPAASDLKSRLIVARENAETSRQEAEVLRSKVDDLQERLANMQKLLSLKDDQLAQLQDRVVTEAAEPSTAEAMTGVTMAEPAEPTGEAAAEVVVADEPPVAQQPEAAADSVVAGGTTEPVVEAPAVAEAMTPPADDYVIQDIPPQIDPDRIVMAADAQSPVAEGAPGVAAEAGETGSSMAGQGEVIVIEDAGEAPLTEQAAVEPVVPVAEAIVVETPVEPAAVSVEPAVSEPPIAAVPPAPAMDEPAAPAARSPLAAMLEQNIVPIAAGGVGLLGLIGWLATRRRRRADGAEALVSGGTAATSAAAAGTATAAAVEAAPAEPVDQPALDAAVLADLPDSSFLDEFSPSDINALQDETGEVDPVSEADVYIAYGRYQQAQELLRQALGRDPDRLALKHKLLEVHYATRNGDAFSALAQEMVDAGQDSVDPEAWARAKDMGRELAAENPLFAKSETDGAFDTEDVTALAAADDDTLSLDDLELSELTAAYDEPEGLANDLEAPSEVSITLDLEDTSELAAVPELALPEAIPMDELGSMDFELPEVEKGVEAAGQAQADDLGPDSLDLDTMMAEAEAAVDQDDSLINLDSGFSADELQAQLDELSDLSAFDSDLDASAEVRAVDAPSTLGLVAEDRGVSPDGLDQPLNLDRVFDTAEDGDELSELIGLDQPQGLDEPAGEDEVATKLDLARAYVDMGDDDGARSILEEVVVEGNDGQRGDAEQLLQRLG
ncbi:MAG: hypothetical protein LJE59_13215 [Chromatiaceae bacterium]|nr:hypothetical protein [Chromatiaceae bacterium]